MFLSDSVNYQIFSLSSAPPSHSQSFITDCSVSIAGTNNAQETSCYNGAGVSFLEENVDFPRIRGMYYIIDNEYRIFMRGGFRSLNAPTLVHCNIDDHCAGSHGFEHITGN